MKSQRFGIEIEMTGLTRRSAALIIAKHFDTGFRHERGVYDTYSVCDQDGRKWKIVRDASITPQCGNRFDYDPDYKVEVVSPICHYEDIETIQSIVRELRRNGHAKVNESCGIHIHVDASKHTARSLRNIANIMYSKEDLIFKALKVRPQREVRFCKKIDDDFLEMLNRKKPKDIEEVENQRSMLLHERLNQCFFIKKISIFKITKDFLNDYSYRLGYSSDVINDFGTLQPKLTF